MGIRIFYAALPTTADWLKGAERRSDLLSRQDRLVSHAPLDPADIGAVQPGLEGERFLREPKFLPKSLEIEVWVPKICVAEVYLVLWSRGFAREGRNGDQHDAYSIAAWLSRTDRDGSLAAFLSPSLTPPEGTTARVEGWILGVA